MASEVIKAEGIKKSFNTGDSVSEILKGIDFSLSEGEFVAIVGESGSGKSTFLYILAGTDKPDAGKVTILSKDINSIDDNELSRMRREDFSFVYQSDNLVENLTVYENITLPLVLSKKKESEFKEKVMRTAEYLGIGGRLKSYPKQLSGGEQQRTAIARALVTDPKVIFLDEPTGSLDSVRGGQVMELLKKINKEFKVALVMVTHSSQHAAYASRIVTMEDGLLR